MVGFKEEEVEEEVEEMETEVAGMTPGVIQPALDSLEMMSVRVEVVRVPTAVEAEIEEVDGDILREEGAGMERDHLSERDHRSEVVEREGEVEGEAGVTAEVVDEVAVEVEVAMEEVEEEVEAGAIPVDLTQDLSVLGN